MEELSNEDPDIRHYSAISLGRIGDGRVIPALVALLFDNAKVENPYSGKTVADGAADALGYIGTPKVQKILEVWECFKV